MEKALEILTYMKASINDEEKMHEKLHSMSGDELHTYLFEAIAELEEAMKPKTCDGCSWSEDCCDHICGVCLRNDELRDMYEQKDNA